MAAALVIHAVLGCGWPYAQGCPCCDTETTESAAATAGCKHEHCDGPTGKQRQGPCNCRLQCAQHCSYLPPQKTPIDFTRLAVSFDVPLLMAAFAQGQGGLAMSACGPEELEPPLRLHLLHQILLI
jgi:hypothetical protein